MLINTGTKGVPPEDVARQQHLNVGQLPIICIARGVTGYRPHHVDVGGRGKMSPVYQAIVGFFNSSITL
jgi:hypothetical protein